MRNKHKMWMTKGQEICESCESSFFPRVFTLFWLLLPLGFDQCKVGTKLPTLPARNGSVAAQSPVDCQESALTLQAELRRSSTSQLFIHSWQSGLDPTLSTAQGPCVSIARYQFLSIRIHLGIGTSTHRSEQCNCSNSVVETRCKPTTHTWARS